MDKYLDRQAAGIALARYLEEYAGQSDVLILALPRGGVPVAHEVAMELSIPMDVFTVRKLGVPDNEELAMGAIASGGAVILNEQLIAQLKLEKTLVERVMEREQKELVRRDHIYRDRRPFPDLSGKTIILVDDGIATGATMRVAVMALRNHRPANIVVAVPVAEKSTCKKMEVLVEQFVCPLKPEKFYAVGMWYEHFPQTSDAQVIELLEISHSTKNYSR